MKLDLMLPLVRDKVGLESIQPCLHILSIDVGDILRREDDRILLDLQKLKLAHFPDIRRYILDLISGYTQHSEIHQAAKALGKL